MPGSPNGRCRCKGDFDAAFLALPPELIQLTMRVNQKYFACQDEDGKLSNRFVCVANIDSSDPAAVVAGNEKVLAARLSDAKFFWDQDLKVPLAEQAKKLDQIVFHEKLGTIADKVERVAKLAQWLVQERLVKGADLADVLTAARLAKADLVTEMVGEFPELQGVIGGYYARAQGQTDAVADAIRDHYKPAGQGDDVPTDAGHGRGQHRRQARHAGRLLLDRREADRLARSLRAAPRRARLPPDPDQDRPAPAALATCWSRRRCSTSSRGSARSSSVTFPDLLDSDDHEHEITAEVGSFTYRHGDRVVVRWKAALTPNIERGKIIEEVEDLGRGDPRFPRGPAQGPAARGGRPPRSDRRGLRRQTDGAARTISSACSPG